jgi:hypothetical protein
LKNLRGELAQFPDDVAIRVVNGMFFEVFFDKTGTYRRRRWKDGYLGELMKLRAAPKFALSITFIRRELQACGADLPDVDAGK